MLNRFFPPALRKRMQNLIGFVLIIIFPLLAIVWVADRFYTAKEQQLANALSHRLESDIDQFLVRLQPEVFVESFVRPLFNKLEKAGFSEKAILASRPRFPQICQVQGAGITPEGKLVVPQQDGFDHKFVVNRLWIELLAKKQNPK